MKKIPVADAVGSALCHDLTRIVKGVSKDAAFRRGHIVRPEDIPLLLSMGKEHVYVWDAAAGLMHEDDAAELLCRLCRGDGGGMERTPVKEGKIELRAEHDGLFLADADKLARLNELDHIAIASRHGGFPVKKGDKLASFRIIPLAIDREKMRRAEAIAGNDPVFRLLPYRALRAGLAVTGSEVLRGRIEDTFTPVIRDKLAAFGATVAERIVTGDDKGDIAAAIRGFLSRGLDMVMCTGGMSVDPDDCTPGAIASVAEETVSYGAPVIPGAMFMLAYSGTVPIVGLPGCVMYEGRTVFDILLPRLAAGERVTRETIRRLGHGGLCLGCTPCTFPTCPFGKG